MRDSAFKIYKAVVNAPEKPKEDKKEEKKKEDKEEEEEKNEEEEEKKSMITRNRDLLLGCSYFDLSHTGYFEAKVHLTTFLFKNRKYSLMIIFV